LPPDQAHNPHHSNIDPPISGNLMAADEIETVLANWVRQAMSADGRLPARTEPAAWVAAHFSKWWKERASESLGEAELAIVRVRGELTRLGGWETFGEALHELAHAAAALDDLRSVLGFSDPEGETPGQD
jgi:hypothetical protein